MEKQVNEIKTLIKKASEADEAHQAMQFAQAALNASNALYALRDVGAERHASDCAVHNEPAYPAGPCDCK